MDSVGNSPASAPGQPTGLKEERTGCINRIRGTMAEFDLVFGKSPKVLRAALPDALEDASNELTGLACLALQRAVERWRQLDDDMRWCDQRIGEHVRNNAANKNARILWAVMTREQPFNPSHVSEKPAAKCPNPASPKPASTVPVAASCAA